MKFKNGSRFDVSKYTNISDIKRIILKLKLKQSQIRCDICGVRFAHQRNVKPHMKLHADELFPLPCPNFPKCEKRLRCEKSLKSHIKICKYGREPAVNLKEFKVSPV